MLVSVRVRRLIALMLVCAAAVLGMSIVLGSGRAQAGDKVSHTCSAADKQFLGTVSSNMEQLGYWSTSLLANDVAPLVVVKQARSEADQVDATRPTDPSLKTTRTLLRTMFLQYAAAVWARSHGGNAGVHMQLSYTLANEVHGLLVDAAPELTPRGCNVAPLLES